MRKFPVHVLVASVAILTAEALRPQSSQVQSAVQSNHEDHEDAEWPSIQVYAHTALNLYALVDAAANGYQRAFGWSTKYTLADSLSKDLDMLIELHDKLVDKVQLTPASWEQTCNDCSDKDLMSFYKFKRMFTSKATEAAVENLKAYSGGLLGTPEKPGQCTLRLRKVVAMMRRAIKHAVASSDQLLIELSSTPLKELPSTRPFTHLPDRGCEQGEGEDYPEAMRSMKDDLKAYFSSRNYVNPLCRELPADMARQDVIDSCSAKCSAMEGCKGFTLYNGTLIPDESFNLDPRIMQAGDEVKLYQQGSFLNLPSECSGERLVISQQPKPSCTSLRELTIACGREHVGCYANDSVVLREDAESQNRCCFRPSVAATYEQEITECFIKPAKDPLWKADSDAVAAWLEALSKEVGDEPAMIKAAAAVKSKRLNGLALESLGEKRAMVHLKLASDEASKLVCVVTAAKAGNDPQACLKPSSLERLGRWAKTTLQKAVRWGAHAWSSFPWESMQDGLELHYVYAGVNAVTGAFDDVVAIVDWLAVFANVAYLIDVGSRIVSDQCLVIEAWIRRVPLTKSLMLQSSQRARASKSNGS